MAENPTPDEENRVLRFRPRSKLAGPLFRTSAGDSAAGGPADDLTKFEGGEEDDEYRHRMMINVIGFVFVVLLVSGGIWIVDTLASMRKNQDCYLSGQRRCTPINAPPTERY